MKREGTLDEPLDTRQEVMQIQYGDLEKWCSSSLIRDGPVWLFTGEHRVYDDMTTIRLQGATDPISKNTECH